jgi:D-glycero-D-manno-heptose 1,7-bisphosphate phosphatase
VDGKMSQSSRGQKNRAVFLDRDGTICEEVGYIGEVGQVRLIPGSGEAVRLLNESGFKVIVVTNQAGVARGFFPESRLEEIHAELERQLRASGAQLDAIYYCPHHPTEGSPPYVRECECRKPATGLVFRAAEDLNVDLRSSYMIGDHFSDIECGQRAGAKTVLLLTGHGKEAMGKRQQWPLPPSHIAADLYDAVQWVLNHPERE